MSGGSSPYSPPAAAPREGEETPSRRPEPGDAGKRPASAPVAALLSLLLPGLGHVYARRTVRGLVWLAIPIVLSLVMALLMRLGARVFILALLVEVIDSLGLRIATVVDAVWMVRRRPEPPAPWPRTLLWAVAILAVSEAHSFGARRMLEAFKIPSGSMIPTLLVGDHVMVDKLRHAARGDVIVFPFPEHRHELFVKRIVGMPGDSLTFHDGHPVINGVEVPSCRVGTARYTDPGSPIPYHAGDVYLEELGDRPYLTFYDFASGVFPEVQGPYAVHPGEVFVVGDNRWNAHDSRMWYGGTGGGVPIETIVGLPFVVWLSYKEEDVDWSRIGLDPQTPHLPAAMRDLQPALDACLAKSRPN